MVGPPKVSPPIGVTVPVVPTINLATGAVTYTFPAVPAGSEQNVTATVPGSPVGVSWLVSVNGTPIGGMVGNQPFGEFYVGPNAVVTITGESLLLFGNVVTTLTGQPLYNPGSAVLQGGQATRGQLGPVAPTQGGGYPAGLTLLAASPPPVPASQTPIMQLTGNARGILVVAEAVPSVATVFENQLGPPIPVTYGALLLNTGAAVAGSVAGYWFLPTMSSLEMQLTFATACIYYAFEVDFDYDYPAVAEALPIVPVLVPAPALGSDWTWPIVGPAHLVSLSAQLVCSGAAANRFASLIINYGTGPNAAFPPLHSVAFTANQTASLTASRGGAYIQVAETSTIINTNAPLPDILLPGGAEVMSGTGNLAGGDQWGSIVLSFSAI
jgi:hypothetical protein